MLVVALLLFVCLAAATLPPLPNIAYLGAGYDLLRGNPHTTDPTQGVDPGFQSFIFNMDNFTNNNTPDNKYATPYGIDVLMCDSCNIETMSSRFSGGNSYSESLEKSVGGSVGLFGVHFSASEDWKTVYQQSTSYQDVFMETEADCCAYTATMDSNTPPALVQNFIDAVNQLPDEYDETAYMNFLYTFGTHALTEMSMGGRFGMRSTISSYSWSQMSSSAMERSVSAGFSLLSFSAAVSIMTATQKQQASDFQRFVSSTNMYETGGPIPANGSISAWSEAVSENPMPLSMTLMQISDVLSVAYFPGGNATALELKQNATLTALANYCNYLLSIGEVPACSIGPDPNFPPHSSFGGIYQNDDCNIENSPNPYTGALACPDGYTDFPVARVLTAASKCGASVYICLENNATDWDPIYNFGGMCQLSGTGIDNRVNPMTGQENCAPDYAPIPIGSTILPDDQSASGILYTCANADDVTPTWQPVGGFFQADSQGQNCVINLYTQAYSCPNGYSQMLYGLSLVAPNVPAAQYICINNNMLGLYVSGVENDNTHWINVTYADEILEQARKNLAASTPSKPLPNKISLN